MMRFALLTAVTFSLLTNSSDAAVDFEQQIKPILVKHCGKCHGEKKAIKKLRLDTAEAIQAFHEDHLIVEGKPEKSELYERLVLPKGDKKLMPKGADPLPADQIKLIHDWIAEGASFTSIEKPAEKTQEEKKSNAKEPSESAVANVEAVPEDSEELKSVKAASSDAITKLTSTGGTVMPLFGKSPLLNVSFAQSSDKATDEALTQLPALADQIVWLNLSGSQATPAGYAHLAKLKNVSQLHLEKSAITDAGVAQLANLPRLTYLNLYGTSVTDGCLVHLVELKRLRKLYVWETKVSYDGAMALQKAIPGLEVSLGWNHPEVAKKRLAKQIESTKQDAAEANEKAEAAAKEAERAKKAKELAEKRLKELNDQLKAIDAPKEEPAAKQEKPKEEKKK